MDYDRMIASFCNFARKMQNYFWTMNIIQLFALYSSKEKSNWVLTRLGAEASAGAIADMLWKSRRRKNYGRLFVTN